MTGDSPIGKKESYEVRLYMFEHSVKCVHSAFRFYFKDTGACLSRMVAVTARVKSRSQIAGLAANSTIPIVNALDGIQLNVNSYFSSKIVMHDSSRLFCRLCSPDANAG